jgi:OST-HTH/LOTUS domain
MANLKNVDRFLNLVRTVVADAGKKKGVQINSMTLAVLNNRLLQKTSRRFNPRDYGAKDLRELLETLRTAFELTSEICP